MKSKLILLCMCLLLSGCVSPAEQTQNGNTMEDLYYFYRDDGKLYKQNLLTGATTTVCADPLCMHGEDCLFTDVTFLIAEGNTLYFSRCDNQVHHTGDDEPYITESICSYDYESGRSRVLCKIRSERGSSLQGMLDYHDGYVYFYRQTPDPDLVEYSLYRVPVDGGDVEDMELSVPMWHGVHHADRLFFFDQIRTLYSTDIHGENRVDEVVLDKPGRINGLENTDDGYLYYTILYEDYSELWRKNLTSGAHEKLYETEVGTIASLYKIDDALYFLIAGEERPYATLSYGRTLTDPYGGKIYRLDIKRKKCAVVYENAETHIAYLRQAGDKIIVYTIHYEDDNQMRERFILED